MGKKIQLLLLKCCSFHFHTNQSAIKMVVTIKIIVLVFGLWLTYYLLKQCQGNCATIVQSVYFFKCINSTISPSVLENSSITFSLNLHRIPLITVISSAALFFLSTFVLSQTSVPKFPQAFLILRM